MRDAFLFFLLAALNTGCGGDSTDPASSAGAINRIAIDGIKAWAVESPEKENGPQATSFNFTNLRGLGIALYVSGNVHKTEAAEIDVLNPGGENMHYHQKRFASPERPELVNESAPGDDRVCASSRNDEGQAVFPFEIFVGGNPAFHGAQDPGTWLLIGRLSDRRLEITLPFQVTYGR